jgi:hypothetical protein
MRSPRLVLLLVVLGCVAPAATASAQAPTACPSTFAVLHDDRIGALALPAGNYTITVTDPARLSCAAASDRLRQFLQDFDGRLPSPWTLDAASASFTGPAGQGFGVALASAPSGGGGGQHPATGTLCPGTFSVLHDDRIGPLRLPAGQYTVTLLSVGRFTCAQATAKFTQFLQDFDGILPGRWIVDTETGTFQRSVHVGFRVKPTGTAPSGGSAVGTRCGGDAFSIDRAHRFPGLRIRPGAYRIWSLGAGCNQAAQQFGRLLDLRQGRLPRGWSLIPASATFVRRGAPQFRVKLAR